MLRTLALALVLLPIAACDSGTDDPGDPVPLNFGIYNTDLVVDGGASARVIFQVEDTVSDGSFDVDHTITVGGGQIVVQARGQSRVTLRGDRLDLALVGSAPLDGVACPVRFDGTGTVARTVGSDGIGVVVPEGRVTACFLDDAVTGRFAFEIGS